MTQESKQITYVVDDERLIASTLAAILKNSGFAAVAYTNPLEALKAAESEAPALLITDVMMPEMTGIELAVRLKSLHPTCKVLLFSGQAATADLLQTARQDGHDFVLLQKPIHPKDLLAAIGTLRD
jgi:FixJ family two-component response regulator